ncbi:MAG: GNAT family N-acetyltransferase [Christensenellaceae bacterium]
MIKLTKENFNEVYEIMSNSFPCDELRRRDEQLKLFENRLFSVYALKGEQDDITAIMTVYDFDVFLFVEHFAVKAEYRNKGLGEKMLAELLKTADKQVCLEVEPPETETAIRRIGFYRRNGFYLNEYPYIQPPISKGKNPVSLMIMTSKRPISETEFEFYKQTLYKKVYNVENVAF